MAVSLTGNQRKQAILVVSFGTSHLDNLDKTIGAVERGIARAFPDYEMRRAFTSPTIINILKQREQLKIDNVKEALEKLKQEGFERVLVQPTFIIRGLEYDRMTETAEQYKDSFEEFFVGKPLLSDEQDYDKVTEILAAVTKEYRAEDVAVVFMGHGTEHEANRSYEILDRCFKKAGYERYIIGTVEASPSLVEVIKEAGFLGVKRTVLLPFMVVAGDHASNDMAGEDEDSWKNLLTRSGFEVECVMRGIGEYREIQNLFIEHIRSASNLKI